MAKAGEQFGKWTIQRKIGSGGQGEVFSATAEEGQRESAIKVIKATKAKKRARFLQEIAVHAALSAQNAPNIVPVIDHNLEQLEGGEVKGFIVMPLAELSLADASNRMIGRTELCLEVFEGVVNGVVQAHQVDVIHRDIKPGNVLFLDATLRNPLVTDFGISLLRETTNKDRLTDAGETVGAKYFMAPEQERGGVSDVGPTADIYALGKLLHHMLTGRFLYREELDTAFTEKEIKLDPRWRTIAEEILSRTVVKDPDQRIESAEELLETVKKLRKRISGTGTAIGRGETGPTEPNEDGRIDSMQEPSLEHQYQGYAEVLAEPEIPTAKISLEFDAFKREFEPAWRTIHESIEQSPEQSKSSAEKLIRSQTRGIALSAAMARTDAEPCFGPQKSFLQWVTDLSENQTGYPAVFTVPHVYAGFLYMFTATAALRWGSWRVFNLLLTSEYEWYYQSGRSQFSHGFVHPYFFHPEALERRASVTHDLYRSMMRTPEILQIIGLGEEKLLNLYLQTELMMCLRGEQLTEGEERVEMWPDFGRFYDYRVQPILRRIEQDQSFADGVLAPFRETRDEFITRFDHRISVMIPRLRGGYFWESVVKWNDDQ